MSDNRVQIMKDGIEALIYFAETTQNPDFQSGDAFLEMCTMYGAENLLDLKCIYKTIDEDYVNDLILRNSLRDDK